MSVNTKMTAIADEIRTLSGTTEAMGLDAMATNVGNANSEVDNQADLISQIVTALEGKAVGGPGGNIETCAVTIELHPTGGGQANYAVTRYIDGEIVLYTFNGTSPVNITFTDIVCGSMIVTVINWHIRYRQITGAVEDLLPNTYWGSSILSTCLFRAPTNSGGSGTILLRDDD